MNHKTELTFHYDKVDHGYIATFQEEIDRIKFWSKCMCKLLELNKWRVRVNFGTVDNTEADDEEIERPTFAAENDVDYEYRLSELTFFMDTINERQDTWEALRRTVVHEFLHIPLMHLAQCANDLMPGEDEPPALNRAHEHVCTVLSELDFWEKLIPLDVPE